MSHQLIDATRWPLFDLRAVRYGERARIGVSLDNIVLDALSAMTFFDELAQLYADLDAELPPVGVSFRDYVEQVEPDPQALESAQAYWRERLDDLPPAPDLPLRTDPARLGRPTFTRREAHVDAERWQAIGEHARAARLDPVDRAGGGVRRGALGVERRRGADGQPHALRPARGPSRHRERPRRLHVAVAASPTGRPEGESWPRRARRVQEQVGRTCSTARRLAPSGSCASSRGGTGSADASMPVVFTSTLGVAAEVSTLATAVRRASRGACRRRRRCGWTTRSWNATAALTLQLGRGRGAVPRGLLDAMFEAYVRLLEWLARPGADWDAACSRTAAGRATRGPRAGQSTAGAGERPAPPRRVLRARRRRCAGPLALAWGATAA